MEATKEKRATFTPGPWVAMGKAVYEATRYREILWVGDNTGSASDEEKSANARLIAAAPAMYEVLQEILAPCPVKGYLGKYDHRRTYNARKKAREILAKVEGGEG